MKIMGKPLKTAILIIGMLLFSTGTCLVDNRQDKVVLATSFSPLAMPMAYIVENHLLQGLAKE